MTFDAFVAQWNNKPIDVDNAYGAQCWDLVELYAEDVLGVAREPWAVTLGPTQSAKEAWTVFDSHMQKWFDKIPAGQEQYGDITVYDGHGPYTEGHIAVCINGTQVFEQNADPDGSPAHVANRGRTYLLGALRKKRGDMTKKLTSTDQVRQLYLSFGIAIAGNDPVLQKWVDDGGTDYELILGLAPQVQNNLNADAKTIADLEAQLGASATVLKPGKYQVN